MALTLVGVKIKIKDVLKKIKSYCPCPKNDKTKPFCAYCGVSNKHHHTFVYKPIEGFNHFDVNSTFDEMEVFFHKLEEFLGYSVYHSHKIPHIYVYLARCGFNADDDQQDVSMEESLEDLMVKSQKMKSVLEPLRLWKNFGIHTIV